MGKTMTVVVLDALAFEVNRFENVRQVKIDSPVLVVDHLGEDITSSGVVLKEGWSFYSHMEVDDEFKVGDWVYATTDGEPLRVLEVRYLDDTGEAQYLCQEYHTSNGHEWRTSYRTESVLTAAEKPDYVKE